MAKRDEEEETEILRRHQATVRRSGWHVEHGMSIRERYWEELDAIVDRLNAGEPAEDGRDPGRAEGIAWCLAVMANPYQPNIEAVREESVERAATRARMAGRIVKANRRKRAASHRTTARRS